MEWANQPYRRMVALRGRRPHHSFVRTRRRDYKRSLILPGYFAFTAEVARMLLRHKNIFLPLIAVFGALTIVLGGVSAFGTYNQALQGAIDDGSGSGYQPSGFSARLMNAGTLAAVAISDATASGTLQQLYLGFMMVMIWLTMVWLLREITAGNKPRFRDGLYSAGAPIMAMLVVVFIMLVQLIPAGVLTVAFTALAPTGMISEGLGAFLFFGVSALVLTLTLYWVSSTFFALIITTLPGMYPWRAMQAASDIVVGRRLRIMYRILWMGVGLVVVWSIIMVPVVMLDQLIAESGHWFANVNFVPLVTLLLSIVSTVWSSAYLYLLYRKVVADDAT